MEFEHKILTADGASSKETLTRQIVIPLSGEVYKPELTGESRFELSDAAEETPQSKRQTRHPLITLLIVLWLASPCLIIMMCIKQLSETRTKPPEADVILKKYSDMIIKTIKPLDIEGYKEVYVPEFKELIKLAAGLNKNILCYCFGEEAEFCVYTDGLAYCYFAGEMSVKVKLEKPTVKSM